MHVQALGISTATAQRILDGNAGGKPSFIPQGSLRQMLAQAPSLPVQFPKLIHRYPLLQNTHEVSSCCCWCSVRCCSMHDKSMLKMMLIVLLMRRCILYKGKGATSLPFILRQLGVLLMPPLPAVC